VGQSWQNRLAGSLTIDYRGSRFALGRTGSSYAIWDTTSAAGQPAQTFPLSPEGWARAWQTFRAWEPGAVTQEAVPGMLMPSPTRSWVKGRPLALAPMRAGQLLDGVFKLYRMHFGTLLPVVGLVVLPVQAVVLVLELTTLETVQVAPGVVFEQPATWVTIASLVVQLLVVTPFLTAAVVRTAADAYLGHEPSVGRSYRAALPRIHSILWVTLLTALAALASVVPGYAVLVAAPIGGPSESAFGLAIALILVGMIPAVFVYLRFSFGSSIVVVEDTRGTKALGRSWRLVRGLTWKVLGVTLLVGLIMFALFLVLGIIFSLITIPFLEEATFTGGPGPGFYAISAVINALATVLVTPIFTLVSVLLYFDARIRKEGFDLAIMAQDLGERSPEPTVPTA
jgi:hypothetical protein